MSDPTMESKILAAARKIFVEKGKSGTRMQDIANEVGINKALLHYYFRSKDRLYQLVIQGVVQEFVRFFGEPERQQQHFADILKGFINHYLDRVAENPRLIHFILWEVQQSHGRALIDSLSATTAQGQSSAQSIQGCIARAVATGEIKPIHPAHIFTSIIGLCAFPYFARPVAETIFPDISILSDSFKEERKQLVFDMIWNYLRQS